MSEKKSKSASKVDVSKTSKNSSKVDVNKTGTQAKESIKKQSRQGYITATGKYKNVESYNTIREQHLANNDERKVNETDLTWNEKLKQDIQDCKKWPPARTVARLFWTPGHYNWRGKAGIPGAKKKRGEGKGKADDLARTKTEIVGSKSNLGVQGSSVSISPSMAPSMAPSIAPSIAPSMASMASTATTATLAAKETPEEKLERKEKKAKDKKKKKEEKEEKKKKKKKKKDDDDDKGGDEEKSDKKKERKKSDKEDAEPMLPPDGDFSTHRLQVANLPMTIREKDLKKIFDTANEITITPAATEGQMTATIRYDDVKEAFQAFKKTKKAKFEGNRLEVTPKQR